MSEILSQAVWATGVFACVVTLEPRVALAGVVHLVGLAVAVYDPDLRYLAHGAGHLSVIGTAWWVLARRQSAAPVR
jgi:hypothetical protein